MAKCGFILQPWQLLLCILAGWMQREQQAVIEYLRTENQVLGEHVRRKRLVLTDDQRRAGGWGRTAEEQPTIAYGHYRQSAPSRHPWAMVAVLGAICRSDSREHSGRSPGRSTPATLPPSSLIVRD